MAGAGDYYLSGLESIYALLLLLCFITGTVGNILSLLHFGPRSHYHSALIYCFITINDITTSLLMLPMSMSYFSTRQPLLFSHPVLCDVWGITWNIISRYSIFLVAVLSITRTISLYLPFRKLSRRCILVLMSAYLLLLVLQATVPYWRAQRYVYYPEYVQCFSLLGELFQYNSFGFITFYVIFIQVEYIAPLFPILISCGLSAKVIKSMRMQSHEASFAARRRAATLTIVIFTLLYAVFNIPAVAYEIIGAVDMYSGNSYNFFYWDAGHRYFRNMITVLSIGLNAASNPALYFWRMRAMRTTTRLKFSVMTQLSRANESVGVQPPPRQRNLTCSEI